ncbi:MAG: GGDEF domain-containing protein, partial [Desulfobulbaceae bacterium]|nr:GGDEF domain-containing protein [Desulfobulbaceae bacterium]
GHDAGDVALRKVGNVLQLAVRKCDLFGMGRELEHIGRTEQYALRMGGEEFCVILLNTGLDGAKSVGERMRQGIAQGGFVYQGEEIPLTASVGIWSGEVTSLDHENEDFLADYIVCADQALYQAKEQGKNRVVVYESSSA